METGFSFHKWLLWQSDRHLQKDEPETLFLVIYKISLKINHIPKCNSDTIKLLEKIENLEILNRQWFFRYKFKSMIHKRKINKLDFIKIQNFWLPLRKLRQAVDWKEIFANHVSNEEFVSRIFKELLKF